MLGVSVRDGLAKIDLNDEWAIFLVLSEGIRSLESLAAYLSNWFTWLTIILLQNCTIFCERNFVNYVILFGSWRSTARWRCLSKFDNSFLEAIRWRLLALCLHFVVGLGLESFEIEQKLWHQLLLNAISPRQFFTIYVWCLLNILVLVRFFMLHYVFVGEMWRREQLLHLVGLRIENGEIHQDVWFLCELVCFVDQELLALGSLLLNSFFLDLGHLLGHRCEFDN